MKNKASTVVKQVFSVLRSAMDANFMALKNKTEDIKTKIIIYSLLKGRRPFLPKISHKLHISIHREGRSELEDRNGGINTVPVSNSDHHIAPVLTEVREEGFLDTNHSVFDNTGVGSIIELFKSTKEDSSHFDLEEEIDRVADFYIESFHKKLLLQKMDSFKSYQEMLDRSV